MGKVLAAWQGLPIQWEHPLVRKNNAFTPLKQSFLQPHWMLPLDSRHPNRMKGGGRT